jgi:hypothetical protein
MSLLEEYREHNSEIHAAIRYRNNMYVSKLFWQRDTSLTESIIKEALTNNTTEQGQCAYHTKSWLVWPVTAAMEG